MPAPVGEPVKKLFLEIAMLVEHMWSVASKIEPMAFVVSPHGKQAMRLTWCDDEEKAFAIASLKADMKAMGALRYGLINEAWFTPAPAAGETLIAPSKSDRRKECVIIHIEDPVEGQMFGWREILTERRRGKTIRTLGPMQTLDQLAGKDDQVEARGNMTNLLED